MGSFPYVVWIHSSFDSDLQSETSLSSFTHPCLFQESCLQHALEIACAIRFHFPRMHFTDIIVRNQDTESSPPDCIRGLCMTHGGAYRRASRSLSFSLPFFPFIFVRICCFLPPVGHLCPLLRFPQSPCSYVKGESSILWKWKASLWSSSTT